jgi:hypothetical protein
MAKSKFYGKTVIVTKEVDESFDNKHPKGINEGARFEGRLTQFEVGYPVYVDISETHSFRSSTVKLIDEESGIFQTVNSIYKIELHPEQVDYESSDECSKTEAVEDEMDIAVEPAAPAPAVEAPHYGGEAVEGLGRLLNELGNGPVAGAYQRFYEGRGNVAQADMRNDDNGNQREVGRDAGQEQAG